MRLPLASVFYISVYKCVCVGVWMCHISGGSESRKLGSFSSSLNGIKKCSIVASEEQRH